MPERTGENIMGVQPIPKLILGTGMPLMVSLLINSLYNFVDSVFVSRVSEAALTAVSLSSPMQILMSALGGGIAVGLNAVISKALGRRDEEGVKKAASAALFLALCAGLLLAVCGLLLVRPYFVWQSAGDAVITDYGTSYLQICMLFSLGQMGQWVFDRFTIASGKSGLFLYTLSAASVTNLILDPILIFGWFGLPAMGVTGAAAATVIGQWVGCLAGFLINRRWNQEIPIHFTLRPDGRSIVNILRVGLPTSLVQGIVSLLAIVVNSILIGFSTTAVAVYGACTKVLNLTTVGAHGINLGVIPIVAYNYGAEKPARISGTIRWAMIYGWLLYLPFLLAMELFPGAVLLLFDASPDMLAIGIPALRILALGQLIAVLCLVLAAGFQGLSRAVFSTVLTTLRQAVLPLVLMLVALAFQSLTLIWSAFLAAELLTLPLGIVMWKRVSGRTLDDFSEEP